MTPDATPDPTAPYVTAEAGSTVYRTSLIIDVEAGAPAVAKFRLHNMIRAMFGMMDPDQGVRLASASALGDAAQWIRGIANTGELESVTHPFDLEEYERMRNAVLEMAAGNVGSDFPPIAANGGLPLADDVEGAENASHAAETGDDTTGEGGQSGDGTLGLDR